MTRISVFLMFCLLSICCALPIQAHATTTCEFNFSTGTGNTLLEYCVTANGNIPQITTSNLTPEVGAAGEGYGICDESPIVEYYDYAAGDSGNWSAATVLSASLTSVKIARTTSDGNWTLTQTITKVPASSSITVVMALKNNQPVSRVAYLLRWAGVDANGYSSNLFGATRNSAFGWSAFNSPPYYGLELKNVGNPPFPYWEAFALNVPTGSFPCNFAGFDSGGFFDGDGSVEMVYSGPVPAHGTKTVTMTYRGL
jgi:hypothetical protein